MRKLIFAIVVLLCLAFVSRWSREAIVPTQAEVRAAPLFVYKDGHAAWYDDCNGSNGACGDCDDDRAHAAWPHLPYTNCYRYCSYVGPLSCGSEVEVLDLCPYGDSLDVEIHDCCTCDGPGGCDDDSKCWSSYWNTNDVIIDLTTTSFIGLHGSLADGRIPVRVYY